MASQNNELKFALEFPQGQILFVKGSNAAYFKPNNDTNAFIIGGEYKELFGRNAIIVPKNRDTGAGDYSVVYEFSDAGPLADARLLKQGQTVRGTLVEGPALDTLKDTITQGQITFYDYRDFEQPSVFNVAQFADGRQLVQLQRDHLYIGTPGNFRKLDAVLVAQAGNGTYYKTPTGDIINLPYGMGGPRPGEPPTFNGEILFYTSVKPGTDPAKIGLVIAPAVAFVDPFTNAPATPAATFTNKAAPKPPGC